MVPDTRTTAISLDDLTQKVIWAPQPGPQQALIDCPLPEIFFGGARGGGKTDGVIGKYAIKGETYGEGFNAIFFRRELPMADDAIERAFQVLGPLGWQYNAAKYQWRSPLGARLRFRPLERVSDAEKYQGQNLSDACVEEAGNYPDPKPIDRLHGVLRSAKGVPTQLILTGNPGGPGQQWIKERYIDPNPNGMEVLCREVAKGVTHRYVFIPSKLQDNRFLGGEYVNRLHLVGSEELVRAWLLGDWDAIEGAFFDCWNDHHIIEPFQVPPDWNRFISGDWGFASPFSFGWWTVVQEVLQHNGMIIPKGALVRYREWYGADSANVGIRMMAEDVGRGLLDRCLKEKMSVGVLDPSTFATDGGPSIAERLMQGARNKLIFRKADNRRVGVRGAMGGWDQMRGRLIGQNGVPMIYTFNTCKDSIRTIPALQHDPNKAEDLDTTAEDHAADDWRYGCMSRPWLKPDEETSKPKWEFEASSRGTIISNVPIIELIRQKERRRRSD